jgi:rhamnosyltransferase
MSATTPRVSVIIRTKNEGTYLERVLQAVHDQDYADSVEIVLVDSGSTDDTLEIARRFAVRLIEIRPEEFTYGRALNIGAKAAHGELLVNLSGHAIPVERDYFQHLLAPFEDPAVWATFGRDVPLPGGCPSRGRDLETWFPNAWADRSRFFSNANACLRKQAWEALPFDEDLSIAEDAKWAQQVLAAGCRIVYVPTASAYHPHPCSPRYIYLRSVLETTAFKEFDPARAHMTAVRALRHWLGTSARDYGYAWRHRCHPKWVFHIPIYRACQAWGFYRASR